MSLILNFVLHATLLTTMPASAEAMAASAEVMSNPAPPVSTNFIEIIKSATVVRATCGYYPAACSHSDDCCNRYCISGANWGYSTNICAPTQH